MKESRKIVWKINNGAYGFGVYCFSMHTLCNLKGSHRCYNCPQNDIDIHLHKVVVLEGRLLFTKWTIIFNRKQ